MTHTDIAGRGAGTLDMDALQVSRGAALGRRASATLLPEPEPRPVWFPFISVDDHVLEPPGLFEKRVSLSMRERVPRVEYGFNGYDDIPFWLIDDEVVPIAIANGAVGRPVREWTGSAQRFEDFRQGVTNSEVRLRDMDLVGAWGTVCFPSIVWGFSGRRLAQMNDPEVGLASLRAYNDWMIEEWCAPNPDRVIPCQLPWLVDPSVAAEEIYSNAERGFRAVSFSENPVLCGFPSIHDGGWDRFFAACEETGTVVNLHVGSSGSVICPDPKSPTPVTQALFPVNAIIACVDWIYSRVPVRFPELKIVLSEGGVSWVPMVIERLRRADRQRDAFNVWNEGDPTPIEVLSRNFWFASLEDPSAFSNLDIIGSENVMLECDYPHNDSTWPTTQDLISSDLGSLSIEETFDICVGNAAHVYSVPLPPRERFESSDRGRDALPIVDARSAGAGSARDGSG